MFEQEQQSRIHTSGVECVLDRCCPSRVKLHMRTTDLTVVVERMTVGS